MLDRTELLCSFYRQTSAVAPDDIISPDELLEMLEMKRDCARNGECLHLVFVHRGTVQTTNGQVVSRDKAMSPIRAEQEKAKRK